MLDGSDIAMIKVEPARFTGRIVCLVATSSGISATTSASTSKSESSIVGTPYWPVAAAGARRPGLLLRGSELFLRQKVLLYEELADPIVQRTPPPRQIHFARVSREDPGSRWVIGEGRRELYRDGERRARRGGRRSGPPRRRRS